MPPTTPPFYDKHDTQIKGHEPLPLYERTLFIVHDGYHLTSGVGDWSSRPILLHPSERAATCVQPLCLSPHRVYGTKHGVANANPSHG